MVRVEAVLADVRDRIKANALDTSRTPWSAWSDAVAQLAAEARSLGCEPHHLDPTAATDFRERMLAAATLATCAVVDHDRRAIEAAKETT